MAVFDVQSSIFELRPYTEQRHNDISLMTLSLMVLVTLPPVVKKLKHNLFLQLNILLNVTFVISIMVSHFDCKHSCLIKKNVPIAFILPSRWQDGAESLGMSMSKVCSL